MTDAYEWTTTKINSLDDFLCVVSSYRAEGKKVVTTSGWFDLLHTGNVEFLNQARAFGNILIVGLNSDSCANGINRTIQPLLSEHERAAMLVAMKSVDHVVVFDEPMLNQLLAKIKPDFHCRVQEYATNVIPEAEIVISNGGEVKLLSMPPGYPTSNLVQRIIRSKAGNEYSQNDIVTNVLGYFVSSGNVLQQTGYLLCEEIISAASLVASCIRENGKIICCGNGGSAADAQHFAAELVGRYKTERSAWPAISLSSDPSVLTAIGNDYGFEQVFSRQVSAWGQKGDVLVAISTSGNSPNVLAAVNEAKNRNLKIIALTGSKPSKLRDLSDVCLAVPSADTPQVQQAHIAILHSICNLVEGIFL